MQQNIWTKTWNTIKLSRSRSDRATILPESRYLERLLWSDGTGRGGRLLWYWKVCSGRDSDKIFAICSPCNTWKLRSHETEADVALYHWYDDRVWLVSRLQDLKLIPWSSSGKTKCCFINAVKRNTCKYTVCEICMTLEINILNKILVFSSIYHFSLLIHLPFFF